jgi:hypothetical protein
VPEPRIVNSVIENTAGLSVDQVVHERVRCPACQVFVFQMWPDGWDAHSVRCGGLQQFATAKRRKEAFKVSYRHLFR